MTDDDKQRQADEVEGLLMRFGRQLDTDIDDDRFRETLVGAIVHHPDRDHIEGMRVLGARFSVRVIDRDAFELRIGFEGGDQLLLGEIETAHVRQHPQG